METTKKAFEAHLSQLGRHTVEQERDTEFWYDTYTVDGEEVGFISYRTAAEPTYHIHS